MLRWSLVIAASLVSSVTHAAPTVHVSAKEFEFSKPPSLILAKFAPNQKVVVRLTAATGPTPVSSEVPAVADASGRIILSPAQLEDALFRAAPANDADEHAMEAYDSEQQWAERIRPWHVSVLSEGKEVAGAQLLERLLPDDAKIEVLRDAGLRGALFRPMHPRKAGCLMVIGGSDGGMGWQGTMARALASRGYCAFALAYFGEEGLPKTLSQIPIEYFSHALDWLSRQRRIDPRQLGVIGYSKGTEAALLLAATDSRVRFAAALLPSAYVFQAIGTGQAKSSWTRGGVDVPFVPFDKSSTWRADHKPLAALYEDSLKANASSIPAATIPVERIRGAVLLLAGEGDWSWPSDKMARSIDARLTKANFSHPHKQIIYAQAGHSLAYPNYWVPLAVMPHGTAETPTGTATAREAAWRELVRFIQLNL